MVVLDCLHIGNIRPLETWFLFCLISYLVPFKCFVFNSLLLAVLREVLVLPCLSWVVVLIKWQSYLWLHSFCYCFPCYSLLSEFCFPRLLYSLVLWTFDLCLRGFYILLSYFPLPGEFCLPHLFYPVLSKISILFSSLSLLVFRCGGFLISGYLFFKISFRVRFIFLASFLCTSFFPHLLAGHSPSHGPSLGSQVGILRHFRLSR